MTKDEALKLALEAFKEINYDQAYATEITAIKEALAQPEQEPALDCTRVACMGSNGCIGNCWNKDTTPPQRTWVGLTDEEVGDIAKNYALNNPTTPLHFAQAIEAKLKEKNT